MDAVVSMRPIGHVESVFKTKGGYIATFKTKGSYIATFETKGSYIATK